MLSTDDRGVGALERALRNTSDLVERTLQMARVASGIELRRQVTTLTALFDEAEIGALSEAEAKGIELRLTMDKDERVAVDARLISSALGNLLRNGVKYSRDGSLVEVRGAVANGRLTIEIEVAAAYRRAKWSKHSRRSRASTIGRADLAWASPSRSKRWMPMAAASVCRTSRGRAVSLSSSCHSARP